MSENLKGFAEDYFPDSKADLFSMFIERNAYSNKIGAEVGMITMQSWMFLPSFESLRKKLLGEVTINSMIHLGARAFDSISGEVVQTTAFTLCTSHAALKKPVFRRLVAGRNEAQKLERFSNPSFEYKSLTQEQLLALPDSPIAYWINPAVLNIFHKFPSVGSLTTSDGQTKSGDNDRFLRKIWEISSSFVGMSIRWALHPKGGNDRRWFGNVDTVIDWSKAARAHYRADRVARILPDYLWNRSGICWTLISTNECPGFRLVGEDEIFNLAAPTLFPNTKSDEKLLLALLNSRVSSYFLGLFNPTINRNVGDVSNIPVISPTGFKELTVSELINISIIDWDNFETSWGFRDLPLLRSGDWEVEPGQPGGPWKGRTLAESWANYAAYCTAAIHRMQDLETENNCLWIDAYGLQDELSPEVPEDEITLARADKKKDVAAFISYAVGCMMGRYSLDQPGLILANAGETVEDYLKQVPEPQFMPDEDNIIPVLDGEWFEDDIVARFREFLRVTFGEDTLRENIQFIEDSLGKDLRKYFVSDFYKDHLSTYKKRPIYWLFQSPKKSFQALIYLHRYDRDTVNLLLNDYLREFQNKLQNRRKHLDEILASESTSARDKTAATREQAKIDKALPELADWERDVILPLAQQRLEIDLDDGVKQNYPKFGKALAKVAGLS